MRPSELLQVKLRMISYYVKTSLIVCVYYGIYFMQEVRADGTVQKLANYKTTHDYDPFADQGEGYFYDPTKDESSFKTFLDWLQCYYQPSMQNLVDHNGRTIWFSGKAGPLAPKGKDARNVNL